MILRIFEDTSNWHLIVINSLQEISEDWIKENIKDKHSYTCFGHYWYFKNESDAILFALRWK